LIWPRRASPWSAGLALLVPSPPRVIPYPARCRARSDERGENQVTRRQGAQTGRKGGHGVNCRNVNVSHERPAGRSQSGCGLRATATDGPGAAQGRRMVGNRLPEIVHVWDCTLLHDVIVHGADLRRGLGMLYQRHCRRLAASSSSSSRAGGGSRAKCAKPTSGWCGSRRTEASCAPHCAHGAARRQRQQQQPDLAAAYWPCWRISVGHRFSHTRTLVVYI
jgi:hypothetical protein